MKNHNVRIYFDHKTGQAYWQEYNEKENTNFQFVTSVNTIFGFDPYENSSKCVFHFDSVHEKFDTVEMLDDTITFAYSIPTQIKDFASAKKAKIEYGDTDCYLDVKCENDTLFYSSYYITHQIAIDGDKYCNKIVEFKYLKKDQLMKKLKAENDARE